jgi:hypothetical protein
MLALIAVSLLLRRGILVLLTKTDMFQLGFGMYNSNSRSIY